MANNTEVSKVRVELEQQEAEKKLQKLQYEAKKLKDSLDDMGKGSPERKKAEADLKAMNKEIKQVKDQLKGNIQVIIDGKIAGQSLKNLEAAARVLRKEIRSLPADTQEFADKANRLRSIEGRIQFLNREIKGTNSLFSRLGDEIKAFGAIAATYLGFNFISGQISNIISKAGKLSDQLADVRKTTQLTAEGVEELNRALGKIDTRTSTSQLREIAIVAGQMGIAKDDVLGFVESIDVATTALGDEFSGGAQEVAEKLGKLRNVFSDIKSDKVDEDLLHIGNALNELSAKGAATSPVVADFANRIASIGIPLGLSTSQVLGLSATLQELNVSTERGGTAVGRILQRMTRNTSEFARIAGLSVKDFETLLNTDLFGAFVKVAEGSKRNAETATEFSKQLDALGVDGAGASEVFAKLGNNTSLLAEKVDIASEAIKGTNSVMNEAKLRNESLGGFLDKLGKKFYAMATSPAVINFLTDALKGVDRFIDSMRNLPAILERNLSTIIAVTTATAVYYSKLIAATIATIANTTATIAQKVAYEAGYKALLAKEFITKAYSVTVGVLTGKITLATAAQRLWNVAMKNNPLGIILAALGALVLAIKYYRENTAAAISLVKEKQKLHDDLSKTISKVKSEQLGLNNAISQNNALAPEQRKNLVDLIRLKKQEALATLEALQAKQKEVAAKSGKVDVVDAVIANIKNIGNASAATASLISKSLAKQKEAIDQYQPAIDELKESIEGYTESESKQLDILNAEKNAMSIVVQTNEQYNEKLRLLKLALDNAVKGSTDYLRIQKEINQVQQTFKSDDLQFDQKAADDLLKNTRDLSRQLRDIKISVIKDEEERERQKLIAKFEDRKKEIQQTVADEKVKSELLKAETEAHEQALTDLTLKYDQERTQLKQKQDKAANDYSLLVSKEGSTERLKAEIRSLELERDAILSNTSLSSEERKLIIAKTQKEIEQLTAEHFARMNQAEWESLVKQKEEILYNTVEGTQERHLAEIDLLNTQMAAELSVVTLTEEQKLEIYRRYGKLREGIEKGHLDNVIGSLQNFQQYATQAIGSGFTILNNKDQVNLQKFKKSTEDRKKYWKLMLDYKHITQEEYDQKIASLDAQLEERQRRSARAAAEREKAIAIFQAFIANASNIIKAYSTPPVPNIPLALLAGALGGLQIAAIKSTPPPSLGKGGIIPEGPSHVAGGLDIVDTQTGAVVANIEGGEPVISRDVYAEHKPLIDSLINGDLESKALLPKLANGGFIPLPRTNIPTTAYSVPDFTRLASNLQFNQTVTHSSDVSSLNTVLSSIDTQLKEISLKFDAVSSSDNQLRLTLEKLNSLLDNPKPQKNYISYTDLEQSKNELDLLKNHVTIK